MQLAASWQQGHAASMQNNGGCGVSSPQLLLSLVTVVKVQHQTHLSSLAPMKSCQQEPPICKNALQLSHTLKYLRFGGSLLQCQKNTESPLGGGMVVPNCISFQEILAVYI